MCAYTILDGAAIPARKRRGYADMAIARWAPFQDPQSLVEWVGDRAMVWAWSKSQILDFDDADSQVPAPRRILPESLYRGAPLESGEELVAMDHGCEGRVWRAGMLTAARWWPTVPGLDDWNQYRRGVGLLPATHAPEALDSPLADSPWTATNFGGIGAAVGNQRRLLTAMTVGVCACVFATLLAAVVSLKFSIWQLERDIDVRRQGVESIIQARENALRDRAAIEAQLDMRPPASQIQLLAEVGNLMQGAWELQEWRMPDASSLELVAKMRDADPSAIVKAWEGSGRFKDVTAEMGETKGVVNVKATVIRKQAQGR